MCFDKINQLQEKLASLRPLNKTELRRIQDDFKINNVYNSNAIEGNTLTLKETALILKDGITIGEKPIKDHLEVIGYKDAFEYVGELADKKTVLSASTIKNIHSLVLMNDSVNKGVYRRVPVTIMGALHTPPQPYLIEVQMEKLLLDYGELISKENIIAAVSEFHLRFEGIHPFIDGNGRTGRLIMNFELIKCGMLPIDIKFTDRRRYYDCFDRYSENNDSNAMTDLIISYEEQELQRYIDIIQCT